MRKLLSRLFRREKKLRYPNGIPRTFTPGHPWEFTEEDMWELHRQLWNGREHG